VSAKHIFSAPASSHYSATVTASWSRTLLYLVVEHQTHVNDRTAVPAPGRLSTYQLWHFSGKIGVLLGFSQKPPDPVLQNFELFLYCFIIGQGPHDHIAIAEECSINLDDMRLHITWIKFALILFVTHSQFSTRHIKMPPYDPDFQTELQPTNNIQAERIRRWTPAFKLKSPRLRHAAGGLHNDPSGKLWSIYLVEADKQDEDITAFWRGEAESILVFVRTVFPPIFNYLSNTKM
jgi:hypothetical protein